MSENTRDRYAVHYPQFSNNLSIKVIHSFRSSNGMYYTGDDCLSTFISYEKSGTEKDTNFDEG